MTTPVLVQWYDAQETAASLTVIPTLPPTATLALIQLLAVQTGIA